MTKDLQIQSLKRSLAEAKWMLIGLEIYLNGHALWSPMQCKEFNAMTYAHTREALEKIYTEERYRADLEKPRSPTTTRGGLTYAYCPICGRSMEVQQHKYTKQWSCCNCNAICPPEAPKGD